MEQKRELMRRVMRVKKQWGRSKEEKKPEGNQKRHNSQRTNGWHALEAILPSKIQAPSVGLTDLCGANFDGAHAYLYRPWNRIMPSTEKHGTLGVVKTR